MVRSWLHAVSASTGTKTAMEPSHRRPRPIVTWTRRIAESPRDRPVVARRIPASSTQAPDDGRHHLPWDRSNAEFPLNTFAPRMHPRGTNSDRCLVWLTMLPPSNGAARPDPSVAGTRLPCSGR
jgi:hypothetical protein